MSEWIKPESEAATRWCSVLRRERSAVLTRCRGSLDECEPHAFTERPPVELRCVACQAAYAAAELDKLAADCGDASQTHAVEVGLREIAAAEAKVSDRYARRRGYIENRDYVPGEEW